MLALSQLPSLLEPGEHHLALDGPRRPWSQAEARLEGSLNDARRQQSKIALPAEGAIRHVD